MSRAFAILLISMAGCSTTTEAKPEDPVFKTARLAKRLTLVMWTPLDDGGTIEYLFKTDSGEKLYLYAMHRNPRFRGSTAYQEIRLNTSRDSSGPELKSGTALEQHLLSLLAQCDIPENPNPRSPLQNPKAEHLAWLIDHVKDRK